MLSAGIVILLGIFILAWCLYVRPTGNAITQANAAHLRCLFLLKKWETRSDADARQEKEIAELRKRFEYSKKLAGLVYRSEYGFFADVDLRWELKRAVRYLQKRMDMIDKEKSPE